MYKEGDVEQALLRLGLTHMEQRRDELPGWCPMHLERTGREDFNPSWSINVETGVHHCFSCGYKGTLLTLVAEVLDLKTEWGRLDFDAAKDWLRTSIQIDLDTLIKHVEKMRESYVSLPKPVEMSEARLAVFSRPPDWALAARKLTSTACEHFGVVWNEHQNAWITPIRHPNTHKLMGWQEKGQGSRLFRNRPTGVQKSKTLFGLDAWIGGTMIVVESPLDAVYLSSLRIGYGVSTFGASVSSDQIELMRQADKLILAFDNPKIDPAGEKISLDMFNRIRSLGMECMFFAYGDSGKKDIGDMTLDEVKFGIENAKHFVFGTGAVYA
jgi:hypothetical protein